MSGTMDSGASDVSRSKWEVTKRNSLMSGAVSTAPKVEFFVRKGMGLAVRENYGKFVLEMMIVMMMILDPFLLVMSFTKTPGSDFYTCRKFKSKPVKSSQNPEWKEVFEVCTS